MRRKTGIPVSIVVMAALGCSPSGSTRPSAVETGWSAVPPWIKVTATGVGAGLLSSAVIDGFRVHPDPGDDGVIHAFTDESVVVNATDIASRPPAEPNYLVVNWGDGPNQRVGCGPCRQDHGYAPGRYTLVASLDGPSGRSITVQVEVVARRERSTRVSADGPLQPFELGNGDLAVGETTFFQFGIPTNLLTLFIFPPTCSPPGAAFYDFATLPVLNPPTFALPIKGFFPGTCTITATGTLVGGAPFNQTITFSVH